MKSTNQRPPSIAHLSIKLYYNKKLFVQPAVIDTFANYFNNDSYILKPYLSFHIIQPSILCINKMDIKVNILSV